MLNTIRGASPGALPVRGAVLQTIGATAPFSSSRPIEIEDLFLDPPGPQELLVRVEAASICHSDLSVVNGSRPRPVPMLLGHESAGVVVASGTEVSDVRAGQRVIMTFLPRCGTCENCQTNGLLPCTAGTRSNNEGALLGGGQRLHRTDDEVVHHHLGVSGFADHAVVDRSSVVLIDDTVPAPVAAVMGCAVLTGGGALLNNAKITSESTVAVVGLGGVGMAGLLTAVAVDCREVIAVDTQQEKLDLALSLGASKAMTPKEAVDHNLRAGIVLEAVGHPSAFESAFDILSPGGHLVTVGLPMPDAKTSIPSLRITTEALTISGSYMGAAVPQRDIPRFIELWRSGRFPVEKLISSTVELGRINEAMDDLTQAAEMRQVFVFDNEGES